MDTFSEVTDLGSHLTQVMEQLIQIDDFKLKGPLLSPGDAADGLQPRDRKPLKFRTPREEGGGVAGRGRRGL